MKKIQLVIITLFIGVFVLSCGNPKEGQNQSKASEETVDSNYYSLESKEPEIDSSTEIKVYQATRTVYTDLINTQLELTPIWEKSQMNGIATLTAKPHFYPSDSLILDAKGMTINSVKMSGKDVIFNYKDDVLKITLDKTYTRNETYTVVIDYVAKPEERVTGGSAAIQSDKGLYFINPKNEKDDFMPQIWTQGETESNSVWFPTIDSPNMKSKGDISITVDNKYKTLSNGKLISSKTNSDGTRTDRWVQNKPISMYLYMIAVGEFSVINDSYTKADGSKLAVDYWVEPEWAYQAKAIFGNTPEMLKFYKDILGIDYPWDKFSQIIVREYVSGAMENVGAVVFGDFMYRDSSNLEDDKLSSDGVIAHELFHHWFGDLVTTESWSNLTVNESFANYSEYLWNEYKYGLDAAQYEMEDNKDGYYDTYPTHNLVWFDYQDKEDMFDGVSYNKGGAILHQLRGYLGNDAFFKSLNLYLTRHQYGTAEAHNLRMAFEDVTGEDMNWYFNEWYYGKGHPTVDIDLNYKYGVKDASLKFTQNQNKKYGVNGLFTIPMSFTYIDNAGVHAKKFKITQKEQTYNFEVEGDLQTIIIDPDRTLLGHYNFTHRDLNLWMNQFANGKNYDVKSEAIHRFFELNEDDNRTRAFSSKALQDSFYGTQLAVIDELDRIATIAPDENGKIQELPLERIADVEQIKFLAQNGSHYKIRSAALGLYLKIKDTKENKLELLKVMSKTEKSYNVLASILEGYIQIDPDNAEKYTKDFSNKYPSSAIDFALADYYLKNHVPGKMSFYKNLFEKSKLRDKGNALMYMGYYSFSSGFQDMKDFAYLIDSVYEGASRYKSHIAEMMIQANEQISYYIDAMKKQGEKEKNSDNAYFVSELEKVRDVYKEVIDKHDMKVGQ